MIGEMMLANKRTLTIGIVGGLSPESTAKYYQQIVHKHQENFHNHTYPRIVITSVCFQQYIDWQHNGEWDKAGKALEQEFYDLAAARADFGLIAANTMHKVLPNIKSPIPILSIIDVVSHYAQEQNIKTLGLTGTKFTMADGFYAQGLIDNGINVLLPSSEQQQTIHEIIFQELVIGKVTTSSIDKFAKISEHLIKQGSDAVLLGCTELQMLTQMEQPRFKSIDSMHLHVDAAWKIAINGDLNDPMLTKPR